MIDLWPRIVGDTLAKISKPKTVIRGTLYVDTSSSAWASELDLQKRRILKCIEEQAGETGIRDLRFRSTAWKSIEPLPKEAATRIPASELKRIRELSEKIANPALREAFEKVLVQHAIRKGL